MLKRLKRLVLVLLGLLAYAAGTNAQIKQITGGGYQNGNGAPCVGCILQLKLSNDAVVHGTGQIVPKLFTFTLDSSGNVPAGSNVWFNDQLQPTGTVYEATLTYPGGGTLWGPEYFYLNGASPLSLQSVIPVNSASIFYAYAVTASANNTFIGTNIFNGITNLSGGGALVGSFTGPTSLKILNNVRYADQFTGADCGAKINAADTDLGATGGEIWVNQNCGTAWTTAVNLGAAGGSHILRIIQPGVYATSAKIKVGTQGAGGNQACAIVGPPSTLNNQGGPAQATIIQANGSNLSGGVIEVDGIKSLLRDFVIDGNKANNPTAGPNIVVNKASLSSLENVTSRMSASHGLEYISSSTGQQESCCARLSGYTAYQNNGDGAYSMETEDIGVGNFSQFESNGLQATVNTSGSGTGPYTVTLVRGTSWSTDSSLVNTLLRINNAFLCQVTAIASTTSLTANNCVYGLPGNLSSVPSSWGSGVELVDSSAWRFIGDDFGGNFMDGLLIWGTTAGQKSFGIIVGGGNQFGSQFQHDIEMIGSDPGKSATTTSQENEITGNSFNDSNFRTPSNTYDNIRELDGGINVISGNYFGSAGGSNKTRLGIEITETASARHLMNVIGTNQFSPTNFGTGFFSDNTTNSSVAWINNQFVVRGTAGPSTSLDLFDSTNAAPTPHKYLRVGNGNFQILNSGFTSVVFGASETGIINTLGIQMLSTTTTCTTGASIGATCTTAAITLPVAYSDTNYRLSCTGLGATNVPIVETYAKSNATFTITIAALTAAGASFSSYDCIATHN